MDHRMKAILALRNGDLLIDLSTGYGKNVKYELMPLLKLNSVRKFFTTE